MELLVIEPSTDCRLCSDAAVWRKNNTLLSVWLLQRVSSPFLHFRLNFSLVSEEQRILSTNWLCRGNEAPRRAFNTEPQLIINDLWHTDLQPLTLSHIFAPGSAVLLRTVQFVIQRLSQFCSGWLKIFQLWAFDVFKLKDASPSSGKRCICLPHRNRLFVHSFSPRSIQIPSIKYAKSFLTIQEISV